MFDKILIANRGEIACRVIRTARRLGIRTVAVYSEPTPTRGMSRLADEACPHRPGRGPQESYLRGDAILDAAQATGAQAIHPGYGFLSRERRLRRGLRRCRASSSSARRRRRSSAMGSKAERQGADGDGRRAAGAGLPRRRSGRRTCCAREADAHRLSRC